MANKIFIGIAMFIMLLLDIGLAIGGTVFLVNNCGTIGFILAPFFVLLVAYVSWRLLSNLYKRFINPVQ